MYFCERTGIIEGRQCGSIAEGGVLDSSPHRHREGYADGKQLIRKAATSALTFMTFS
jgi:hypothetical protein